MVMASCDLLGPTGLAVQSAITGVCAAAFLVVWLVERPRRPFVTWLFDISKQIVGAAYGKLYNILQAEAFAKGLRHTAAHQDQCVWYLMGIATDCFLTTGLCWITVSQARPIVLSKFGIDIGDYDGDIRLHGAEKDVQQLSTSPFYCHKLLDDGSSAQLAQPCLTKKLRMWLVQTLLWLVIITLVRFIVTLGMYLFQDELYFVYASFFEYTGLDDPDLKLVFVVLMFPALGDTLQIVVQDRFLKKPRKDI